MNIGIIAEWVEISYIQYLIVATVLLGLINCLKWLIMGR